MATPNNLRYTKDHTWVLVNGNEATIGITDVAQKQLGEIVFVEIYEGDRAFSKEDEIGTIESVKAVSEIFSPLSGTLTKKNELLMDDPSIINDDAYGDGWIIKLTMTKPDEVKELLTAADYDKYCTVEE